MDERWLPMPGYEHAYEISDLGRVRALNVTIKYNNKTRKLKPGILKFSTARAYLMVNCYNCQCRTHPIIVHRAVAKAFIPGFKPGLQVNHKNGNKYDNRVINLELVTKEENIVHAHKYGLFHKGSRVANSVPITGFNVNGDIKRWPTISAAAKDLNCNQATISVAIKDSKKLKLTIGKWVLIRTIDEKLVDKSEINKLLKSQDIPIIVPWQRQQGCEQWRPVKDWEKYYEISDLGRVRRITNSKILKSSLIRGYAAVTLYVNKKRKTCFVHRLVAQAFCQQTDVNQEVDHINNVKTDNRAENLRWISHQRNVLRSAQIPLKGTLHPRARAITTIDEQCTWPTGAACAKALNVPAIKVSHVCRENDRRLKKGSVVFKTLHGFKLVYKNSTP